MAGEELYTCGSWTVVAGREDEFVAAWQDLAEWTAQSVPGAAWATLLQDQEHPSRFLSFGPRESLEAIAGWRASAGFQEHVARIRELLEAFEPGLLAILRYDAVRTAPGPRRALLAFWQSAYEAGVRRVGLGPRSRQG